MRQKVWLSAARPRIMHSAIPLRPPLALLPSRPEKRGGVGGLRPEAFPGSIGHSDSLTEEPKGLKTVSISSSIHSNHPPLPHDRAGAGQQRASGSRKMKCWVPAPFTTFTGPRPTSYRAAPRTHMFAGRAMSIMVWVRMRPGDEHT
jgi:hypothetical protein